MKLGTFHLMIRPDGATSRPQVGNGLWVTSLSDLDGSNLEFQRPTGAAAGSKLSEVE